MALKRRTSIQVGILIGLAALTASVAGQDWPQWRGTNRDGAVSAFTEPASWPDALKQRWQIEVGQGYATPILVGQRVYMFTRQNEEEVMTALDAATGQTVWRSPYAAPFNVFQATARHGPGPKSTPTFANGRLFTLGMSSIVTAFDASNGKQIWQKPAPKAQPQYHTAMSPVVDGDLVIVHVGGPGAAALTAYNVATGDVKWMWDGDSPAYGSPIVADFAGTRQVIVFTHQNLIGVNVATGELLWKRPFTTPSNTTAQTPIVYKDMIIQAGRDNGFVAFRPTKQNGAWTTPDVWKVDRADVSLHMTNGVAANGVLYGLSHLNSGQYFALDLDTGKVLWKSDPRQAENAAMVRAGNTILSLEEDADMVVLKASRDAFTVVHKYPVAMSATWAQPVVSGNRVFVKDVTKLTLWTLN
jgi:outer membrane protein assembly factor BamB